MSTADLIDPDSIHKFVTLIHERAAAAIAGVCNARSAVLHLCSAAPDDKRFYHSAYNVGDIARMVADVLIENRAGKNCYIEPRLIRPGLPQKRGRLESTLAVYASVADDDSDNNKSFTAVVPPSAVVQTSEQNEHSWYFLKPATGAGDAQELGRLMRQAGGGDHCTGNPVQPFRCGGTVNYPDKKKIARGRVPVLSKIKSISGKTYTIDELWAQFYAPIDKLVTLKSTTMTPELTMVTTSELKSTVHSTAYSRGMAKAILAAEPGADRSANFMAAANHAVRGGLTADEFEAIARKHLSGCAGKYGDRLRQEIDRCYAKIVPGHATAYANESQRRFMWHRSTIADSELGAGALRFAYLIAHEPGDDRHVSISLQKAATELGITKSTAQRGRDQLVQRKWLICVAPSCYALGRGPYATAYPSR